MKHAGGRPSKITDELLAKAQHYADGGWEELGDAIPMVEGLADYIGLSRETIYTREEFSDILEDIKSKQSRVLQNKSLQGKYNPVISKLLLSSKHGFVEKTAQDITSKGEMIGVPDPTIAENFKEYMKNR